MKFIILAACIALTVGGCATEPTLSDGAYGAGADRSAFSVDLQRRQPYLISSPSNGGVPPCKVSESPVDAQHEAVPNRTMVTSCMF